MDGLMQDCSNSTDDTLELLQSYTKPSIYGISFMQDTAAVDDVS